MPRVGRITRISLVVLAALGAASCSGDDDSAPDPDEDATVVESALLTIDDLPDGYTETEPDEEAEETANTICNDEVLGLSEDEVDAAKTAESGAVQFEADELRVRAEITAFEDGDVPSTIIEGVTDREYIDCLADAVAEELPDGVSLGTVETAEVGALSGDDDYGAIGVHFDSGGTLVESQIHAVRVGRYGISLEVTALEGEVDRELITDALEVMVERLRDA